MLRASSPLVEAGHGQRQGGRKLKRWRKANVEKNNTKRARSTIGVAADGAALALWDVRIFTVGRVLADHLVAHDAPFVANADLAGFWFPYILVVVRLAV